MKHPCHIYHRSYMSYGVSIVPSKYVSYNDIKNPSDIHFKLKWCKILNGHVFILRWQIHLKLMKNTWYHLLHIVCLNLMMLPALLEFLELRVWILEIQCTLNISQSFSLYNSWKIPHILPIKARYRVSFRECKSDRSFIIVIAVLSALWYHI